MYFPVYPKAPVTAFMDSVSVLTECERGRKFFHTQSFNVKQPWNDAIHRVKAFAEEIDPYAQPKRGIRRQTFVP